MNQLTLPKRRLSSGIALLSRAKILISRLFGGKDSPAESLLFGKMFSQRRATSSSGQDSTRSAVFAGPSGGGLT